MKPIVNRIYDIWYEVTDELLKIKDVEKEDFKEEGREAWKLIMKCSQTLNPDTEASTAFWAAWGGRNLTYSDIAKRLTKHRRHKHIRSLKQTVTADNVKSLLSDARERIQKCLKREIALLRISYER